MSNDRGYELYLEGSELARQEDWPAALPVLEESWHLQPHAKTGLWISRCAEALGDAPKALLFAAASYAMAPTMSDVAVQFARLTHQAGDADRADEVLASVQQRDPDYGPAQQLIDELGAKQ